jgi:tyrosyl-tRNA synthetase
MGKTEGNVVFLDEPANDIYGKVMSWPDGTIMPAFELCTLVPLAEIKKMEAELKSDRTNPRDLKMKLALEITKINRGSEAATAAQTHFISTIQKKEVTADNWLKVKPRRARKLPRVLLKLKLIKTLKTPLKQWRLSKT